METSFSALEGRHGETSVLEDAAATHPRYAVVRSAVDRLAHHGIDVRPPTEIREWDGDSHHGIILELDAATYAIHVGRGRYLILDVERDLNGVRPPDAARRFLCRSGNVRVPDRTASYSAY